MVNYGLNSISFPSIGTEDLKYPFHVVAGRMIKTCFQFMANNSNKSYNINIVLNENDPNLYLIDKVI